MGSIVVVSGALALGLAPLAIASCAESTSAVAPGPPDDAGGLPEVATLVAPPDATPPVETCPDGGLCVVNLPITTPVSLNGVWSASPDDVWIVGSPDLTLHWDGAHLAAAPVGTKQTLFGVWGSGKDDVWAFSSGNAMWHSRGFTSGDAGWSYFDGGGPNRGWSSAIAAMAGRGPNDVWAVGNFSLTENEPPVWHADGWNDASPAWTPVPTSDAGNEPIQWNAIATAGDAIVLVGMGGKTRVGTRTDAGADFVAVQSGTSFDLYALWIDPSGDFLAAGAGGTLRRFARGAGGAYVATAIALPTTETLYAIAGSRADDLYVVGAKGTILHFDGAAWRAVPLPLPDAVERDLYAAWMAGPADLWIAGRNTLLHSHAGGAP